MRSALQFTDSHYVKRLYFGRSADREPGWKVSVGAGLWKRSCSSNLKALDPLSKIQFSPWSYSVELQGDIKLIERALTPVTFWHFTQEKMNQTFFL